MSEIDDSCVDVIEGNDTNDAAKGYFSPLSSGSLLWLWYNEFHYTTDEIRQTDEGNVSSETHQQSEVEPLGTSRRHARLQKVTSLMILIRPPPWTRVMRLS
jgi:hypothetical protein